MKMDRKTQIIGLSAILAVLLVGVGVLSWQLLVPKAEESEKGDAKSVPVEKTYTETLLKEDLDGSMGRMVRYSNGIAVLQGSIIVDVDTSEPVFELPAAWIEKWNFWLSDYCFTENNDFYAVAGNVDAGVGVVFLKHFADGSQPDQEIYSQGFDVKSWVPSEPGPYMVASKFRVDDNYFYLQASLGDDKNSHLRVFTKEGELHADFENVQSFELDGRGGIYISKAKESGMNKYDVVSKEKVSSLAGQPKTILQSRIDEVNNLIYVVTMTGVCAYSTIDGAFVKDVMNMAKDAVSMSSYVAGLEIGKNGSIYFLTYDKENKKQIYKYEQEDNARKDMPYTLRITAPFPSDFINRMIVLYEAENPDERINYDCAYNSRLAHLQNGDADRYYDKQTIAMITGDCGDIVMCGSEDRDIYNLFSQDIFMDLTEKIKQDPVYKNLDPAILEAITINDKIRGMPVLNTYFFANINMDLCEEMGINLDWENATWSEVLALTDKFTGTDKFLFEDFQNTEYSCANMIASNTPDLVDRENKKVDLRQPWFLDLLEQWKKASKNPNFSKTTGTTQPTGEALICISDRTEDTLENDLIDRYRMYSEKVNGKGKIVPMFAGEKHTNRMVNSPEMYAISQASTNKESAWKFLSFMVQTKTLSKLHLRERPINIEARNYDHETSYFENRKENAERYKKDIEKVYRAADYLYDRGYTKEALFLPLQKYFSGEITLDEALEKAEHDIWIWLNE